MRLANRVKRTIEFYLKRHPISTKHDEMEFTNIPTTKSKSYEINYVFKAGSHWEEIQGELSLEYYHDEKTIIIKYIGINEELQNNKLGTKIVLAVENAARDLSVKKVIAWYSTEDKFWESNRYSQTEEDEENWEKELFF